MKGFFRWKKRVKNIGFELVFDAKKKEFYLENFLSKERYDCEADFEVSKEDFKAVLGEYMQAVKNKDSKKHFQYKLTKNTGQKRAKREGLRSVMGRVYAVYNGLKKDFEEKKKKMKLSDFKVLLVRKGIDLAVKRADFKGEKDKIRAYLFYDKKTGVKYSATDLKLKLRDFGFLEDDLKIENNKNLEYPVNIGNVFRLFLGSSWGGEDPDPYKSVKRKKRMDRDLGIR